MDFQNITLKGLRKLREVPARQIAEHIGISLKTYYDREQDPKKFTIWQALQICHLLCIDCNEFLQLKKEAEK